MKKGFVKKLRNFKNKHKVVFFISIFILTIIITRLLVLIKDPNFLLKGFELHHFYYGVVLLILITLDMIFGDRHPLTYLIISAIAIGLIIDEFIFIGANLANAQYVATWPSAVVFAAIIIILALAIEYIQKKF